MQTVCVSLYQYYLVVTHLILAIDYYFIPNPIYFRPKPGNILTRRLCRNRRRDDNELYRSNSFKFERFERKENNNDGGVDTVRKTVSKIYFFYHINESNVLEHIEMYSQQVTNVFFSKPTYSGTYVS